MNVEDATVALRVELVVERVQVGVDDGGKQPDRAGAAASRPADTDRVEVSSDAKLVAALLQAVYESPSVRPDLVERARQSLANDTLGADAERLADRIISSLLGD